MWMLEGIFRSLSAARRRVAPERAEPAQGPAVCEATLRQRAYEIWEAEGRPVGRELEHWEEARRQALAA